MTQLTHFGPEATPIILSLAQYLAHLDHCVMVMYVQSTPDPGSPFVLEPAHLTGIRMGLLQVCVPDFDKGVQAVVTAGFGHLLVVWDEPAALSSQLALKTEGVTTERLSLQAVMATLTRRIEKARLAGTGPLALTLTNVPPIH